MPQLNHSLLFLPEICGGNRCYGLPEDMQNGRGLGLYIDKAQQEGREKGGHSLPSGHLRQEVILCPLVLKRVSVMVVIHNTTGTGWGSDVIAPIGTCNDSVKPMIFLSVVKVQVIFCSFVCFSDLKSKFHPRR